MKILEMSAAEMLEEHGTSSLTGNPDIHWIGQVQFISGAFDWEIGIGDRSYLVSEQACCRVIYALLIGTDIEAIRKTLADCRVMA